MGHSLAVLLELSILATFVAEQSALGVVLCLAYGWFSATRALF